MLSMKESESTDLQLEWSTTSSTGKIISTTLPQVCRTFEDFAKVDVFVGDIDPTYWAMESATREFGMGWTTRFCVGMLTFYHMGTAAQAADYEGEEFWAHIKRIYLTSPRASERRHFRANAGYEALMKMERTSPDPVNFFQQFPQTYQGVKSVCESRLTQFGPYFQLKICDYMDRCLGTPIHSFAGLERNLPGFPLKAAKMLYPDLSDRAAFMAACDRLDIMGLLAPPKFDRPLGPAEVETILCDWKRAKTGSSWMGADILDKRMALQGYGEKAEWMRNMMPPIVPQGKFKAEL